MFQRNRSASLPKDVGDVIFIGDSDFHSDVYDDTVDEPSEVTKSISSSSKQQTIKIILVVMTGSISSVIFEKLLRVDGDSALLSALVLHVWTVAITLPHSCQYLASPKIPYCWHFLIVLLSFAFLFLKSLAIKKLPMPLLIVCSNLQLVFGLVVGRGIFKKTFSFGQYIGVVTISVGCILIALSSQMAEAPENSPSGIFSGILCIMASIMSVAIMIPTGSMLVQRYNADVQEQIFMQHFLSLPLFLLQWDRLSPCLWRVVYATEVYTVGTFSIPVVVILLFSTTVFAQINRHMAMDICLSISPLASQLVNAVNKTIVLLVSMLYFNAPPYPSALVWLGVVIQTLGSIAYVKSSYSDTSSGDFKPNKRHSRFSRVSWTGSRIFKLSESDIEHLRKVANASRRNEITRVTHDPVMTRGNAVGEDSRVGVEFSHEPSICNVSSVKMRRSAFSAGDSKKHN